MTAFPNWLQFAVRQRRPNSGCIPTGYEILARSANVQNVNFDTFQDDLDLDQHRTRPSDPLLNHFDSIADAVRAKYPHVNFKSVSFEKGKGQEKVAFIDRRIAEQKPTMISISLGPIGHPGAWHTVVIVDATETQFHVLWGSTPDDKPDVKAFDKAEIARIHDVYPGGDEVAFLDA